MKNKFLLFGVLFLGLILFFSSTSLADYTTYNNSVTFEFNFSTTAYTTYNNSVTSVFELYDNVTAPNVTDSCTYTSGNWNVKCSDACNITTAVALGNNNITFNGTGTVFIGANISGWKRVDVWTGCTVIVNRSGGGFV